MPYVSELLGAAVVGERSLGRVRDVLASPGALPVVSAVVSDAGRFAWSDVRWDGRSVRTSASLGDTTPPAGEVSISRGLLDRQILDARGLKVVRVNDVELARVGDELRVTGVDVGARGFLRRLGVERIAARIADLLGYDLPDAVIPWSYVKSLEPTAGITLGVERELISTLRPVEVADILGALSASDRPRFLRLTDDIVLAGALREATPRIQEEALAEVGEQRASEILGIMPPDEAADVLGALPYDRAERLLGLIGISEQGVLRMLLGYHPRTAGGLMTPELVSVSKNATCGEAIAALRTQAPRAESVYYVYAVDEERRLRGVVPLAALLTAPASAPVSSIVRTDVVRIEADEPDGVVAETMERYDLLALPVVDAGDVLLGIITVDDVMRTLETRASEGLGAVSGGSESDAAAAFSPGHLGALLASLAAGLAAALLLQRAREASGPWLVLGVLPLLLRLTHDLASWSFASHLEEGSVRPLRADGREVAASALSVLPVAVLLAVIAAATSGVRLGAVLGGAVIAATAVSATVGALVPRALAAGRATWLRVIPIAAALAGLATYVTAVRLG